MVAEVCEERFPLRKIAVARGGEERVVEIYDGFAQPVAHILFPHARDDHEMAATQQAQRWEQMRAVFGAEIREQHDERAPALHGHEPLGGLAEIARRRAAAVVVEMIQHGAHRVLAFHGRQPAVRAAEAQHADAVALLQRDVAEEERGIQAVIKLRQRAVVRAHPPSAIEHEDERLVLLLAIFARDEMAAARGGLPVHLRKDIAVHVFAELVKFAALPGAVFRDDAHHAFAIAHREQRVADDRFVVWIHFHRGGVARSHRALPEAERRLDAQVAAGKCERPACERRRLVAHFGEAVPRHLAAPRELRALDGFRQALEKFQRESARIRIAERDRDFPRDADGETSGRLARYRDRFQPEEQQRIHEQRGCKQCERPEPQHVETAPHGRADSQREPDHDEPLCASRGDHGE